MHVKSNPLVKSQNELSQLNATKILLSGVSETRLIVDQFGKLVIIIATDNNQFLQIMPLNASKEQAVTKLCEKYNLGVDSVIVFGDDHNDIGLFKICGYSVAMGNAIKELKELAHETTLSNDQDGVALVLERLYGG